MKNIRTGKITCRFCSLVNTWSFLFIFHPYPAVLGAWFLIYRVQWFMCCLNLKPSVGVPLLSMKEKVNAPSQEEAGVWKKMGSIGTIWSVHPGLGKPSFSKKPWIMNICCLSAPGVLKHSGITDAALFITWLSAGTVCRACHWLHALHNWAQPPFQGKKFPSW